MAYKIGSFNVMNLSRNDAAKGASRDLWMIADIINHFDIVALQEVLGEGKILTGFDGKVSGQAAAYEYSLKNRLEGDWDIRWLDPKVKGKDSISGDVRGEGYAFLWRKDKFELLKDENGNEIEPTIFHNYKVNKRANEKRLIRDPAYGRFRPLDMETAEIRLITTHIIYNKPSGSDDDTGGAFTWRKNEFKIIAKDIYTRISENHNQIQSDSAYTIIMGDYNMNLRESGASYPFVDSVMVFDANHNEIDTRGGYDDEGFYHILTEQTELSTVNRDGDKYASNYDHFSYDDKTKAKVIQSTPHRLDYMVARAGGLKEYKEKVSDHIPVMVEISFK